MSDLYRLMKHDRVQVGDTVDGLIQHGVLVPVEPVGTLTVTADPPFRSQARLDDGLGDPVEFVTALPPGEYLIVEADDE